MNRKAGDDGVGVKAPHLLLASPNCRKMQANIQHLLDPAGKRALADEINKNVIGLFRLGEGHHAFTVNLTGAEWRQIVSRLYYAAFNVGRAVRLDAHGIYSTEVADHKKVDEFPQDFPNVATYTLQLPVLREDRNLCDYDHTAAEADLLIPVVDARQLVEQLLADARAHLRRRGVAL